MKPVNTDEMNQDLIPLVARKATPVQQPHDLTSALAKQELLQMAKGSQLVSPIISPLALDRLDVKYSPMVFPPKSRGILNSY